ncbi:MAG: division/cell wall cluster transcriptional repressor MraZ [Spirochaetaceae bacterium]|jgi:MraZ protein|nr:division/cell wall cluster transcriptional repressor MraZ [Spirochaetaceae bacterium]
MALSGGFNNTLDDKGRVNFPARLRGGFSGDILVITRGLEKCLYLFPPPAWKDFEEKLEQPAFMSRDWRKIQRHFLGWATESEIDKSGRLTIPQSLREYASLTHDVIVMGLGKRVEIWDAVIYKETQGEKDGGQELEDIAEKCGLLF